MLLNEILGEGDVIKTKFDTKRSQKGKDKYSYNDDIANSIPMWDPIEKRNIPGGVDYPESYVDRSTLEPYKRFEIEDTGKAIYIIGITRKNVKVRISTSSNIEIAQTIANAYNRGGFTDKDVKYIKMSNN